MNAYFVTFGCKVNQYETQAMRQQLQRCGYDTAEWTEGSPCDDETVIIVNSCTVTGESDRKLRQALRRLRRCCPQADRLRVCPAPGQASRAADRTQGDQQPAPSLPDRHPAGGGKGNPFSGSQRSGTGSRSDRPGRIRHPGGFFLPACTRKEQRNPPGYPAAAGGSAYKTAEVGRPDHRINPQEEKNHVRKSLFGRPVGLL